MTTVTYYKIEEGDGNYNAVECHNTNESLAVIYCLISEERANGNVRLTAQPVSKVAQFLDKEPLPLRTRLILDVFGDRVEIFRPTYGHVFRGLLEGFCPSIEG